MAAADGEEWKIALHRQLRAIIVNIITHVLMRCDVPNRPGDQQELLKIASNFEERIFDAAKSKDDYLRRIYLKMITMESRPRPKLKTMESRRDSSKASSSVPEHERSEARDEHLEYLTRILLEYSPSERSFNNTNYLSTMSASKPIVISTSTPSSSKSQKTCGEQSTAHLSEKALVEQKLLAARKAKRPMELPSPKVSGVKRKALIALSCSQMDQGVLSLGDFLKYQDQTANAQIEKLHPLDCLDDANVLASNAFQHLLVAISAIRDINQQEEAHMSKLEEKVGEMDKEAKMLKAILDEKLGLIKELEDEMEATRVKDAIIARDVGAYYWMKSRLQMIEEFRQGKHESWDLEEEKAKMEVLYFEGNPGDKLFRLIGIKGDEGDASVSREEPLDYEETLDVNNSELCAKEVYRNPEV